MSEKQLEIIRNSKLSDYQFDETDMPKSLFNDKFQEGENEIAVDIDDKMMSFYTHLDDYRIDIYLRPYNGHEVLFTKKIETQVLTGSSPETTTELFSAIKACIAYFIIYKDFKPVVFNFKASKKNKEEFKNFWIANKDVPRDVRKDMEKFETLYPAIYKEYQKLLKKMDKLKNIRAKMYEKTIKAVGGKLENTVDEEEYVFSKFTLPQSFYNEVRNYYESI